ncbi:GNAT family N-acetyltransferase [Bacillaceae bacterium SIJ1]|uniref:GNAT family N-acetyltransferase n=1 Tax=Litoribacterium kuwaitense TaxID=1398745 RepID=UPI0013ED973A|nr:GNAT family N-acetyltransferase [Litoribacterium kuwaitense]NGP44373.1 GNAT family N-acetyltransferase [Litoribacterium kuwaitense]
MMDQRLHTELLVLLPCSVHFAKSIALYMDELRARSPVKIPDAWPSDRVKMFLPFYLEAKEAGDDTPFFWVIISLEDVEIIGEVILKPRRQKRELELSYQIESTHRLQGYGFEAVNAVCEWARGSDLKKIVAETALGNIASERLLQRVGLVEQGIEHEFKQWELVK